MQITLEIGVFALVTALIGRLGAISLASHQIALNTVSLTYMVPLGYLQQPPCEWAKPLPRRPPEERERLAERLSCWCRVHDLRRRGAAPVPSMDRAHVYAGRNVIRTTILLLAAGAAFQLFDGIQTVATGALRGAGDTRTPMFLPFHSVLDYWSSARRMVVFLTRMGRFRSMVGLEPRADLNWHCLAVRLAPHGSSLTMSARETLPVRV